MRFTLPEILDPNLHAFLQLLGRSRLHDIIVLGGAVRDALLERPCNDIDIAVRLQAIAPTTVVEPVTNGTHYMVPALAHRLRPLAAALGLETSAFYDPVPFREVTIDVLGLAPVTDDGGRAFPDVFVDANQRIFSARPELSVNQLMLDSDRNVWPISGIEDLNGRVGRAAEAPLPMHLRQILRALRTSENIGLTLTRETAKKMIAHLQLLENPLRFRKEMREEDALRLLQGLIGDLGGERHVAGDNSVLKDITSIVRARATCD